MSNYRYNKKETTDSKLRLSIDYLIKERLLKNNQLSNGSLRWSSISSGENRGSVSFTADLCESYSITLKYQFNKAEDIETKIYLTTTAPYFGGVRYWFLCPRCGKKFSFLYGGKYFLCRTCHSLCYESQQLSYPYRMLEMSRKYERRAENKEKGYGKKKGMHLKTYEKLLNKSERYESRGAMSIAKIIDKFRA